MLIRQGTFVLLFFAVGGCCGTPGASFFSSDDAVQSALCLALRWHDDAVLQGVDTGQDPAQSTPGATRRLQDDGRSQEWIVTFAAPSARCTSGGLATKTFTVQSGSMQETGNSCGSYQCSVGLSSAPVDSTVVVPPAWKRISVLPGFPGDSATLVATNQYHCEINNGYQIKHQYWQVISYWPQGSSTYQTNVDFTTDGQLMAVHGPCLPEDVNCLTQ